MLPSQSTSDALQFTGAPSHLAPFLTTIAKLAVQARVLFSGHIKLAIHYANLDEAEFWEMLPEATAPLQDWMSFIDALIELYPGCNTSVWTTVTDALTTQPDTDHIATALTTDPKSATVHHVCHHHSYHPIITTALTTNTKPDSIPLCPTFPAALSVTTKSNTDLNNILTTYPETNHIHHYVTDPETGTDITTTSNIEIIIDSDHPTTDTDTITLTITNSDPDSDYYLLTFNTVTTMDNLANTTLRLATDVTSDCSFTNMDATTLTATDVTFPPSINSLLLSFSTIALTVTATVTVTTILTATNRQYLTIDIQHCLILTITNPKTATNPDHSATICNTTSDTDPDYPTNQPTASTKSKTVSDYPTITFATTSTDHITDTDHTTDTTKTDTTPD
ncbi:hypothetical protein OG21DRAFT_1491178 [Imleria badia]|nr:hypothetical protein OG21DRAFT_1491178 [Imleria badia]